MINVFVCHRPYHVLRSADLVYNRYNNTNDTNILFKFNVIDVKSKEYRFFQSYPGIEELFDEVILVDRSDDKSIWAPWRYIKYQKSKIEQFRQITQKYSSYDNLFFFSDLEKPIELLVGVFKSRRKETATNYLIDEGVATYVRTRNSYLKLPKLLLVMSLRLKYINRSVFYGDSFLYDKALASFPEKALFHGQVEQLPAMSAAFINHIHTNNNLSFFTGDKIFLYVSSMIYECFGISQREEINVLEKIKEIVLGCGGSFYVKPHPVQDSNYYKISNRIDDSVIDVQIPAELLMDERVVVASFGSSSLINASVQGIKAMDLAGIFGKPEKKTRVISIFYPDSIREIEEYLKRIW